MDKKKAEELAKKIISHSERETLNNFITKIKMELIFSQIEELEQVVQKIRLYAGERRKWLLSGEIGAGKTTFTQYFCRSLNVREKATSPTFSLINQYSYYDEIAQKEALVHHLDLYRLKNVPEAIDIGIEDLLYDDSYCLIEWPALIEPILPPNTLKINIEILENSTRKIIFL